MRMMTTSHEETHIKPIIVSHHYRHHQVQSTTTSDVGSLALENNISSLPKSSSSFKRVSFGNSKGTVVETFIYESVPTIEEGYYGRTNESKWKFIMQNGVISKLAPASPSGLNKIQVRESIDTVPSKVKITTLESQTPLYISPPTAIGNVSVTKLNNGGPPISGGGVVLIKERRDFISSLTSPLSSSQNMDEDSENPFRPDGRLSHEVEPIVECYKKRPFPGSTASDIADGMAMGVDSSKSPPSSPPGKKGARSSSPPVLRESSKNGGGRDGVTKPQDIKLTLTTVDGHNTQLEVQHKQLTSPKAGRVEVVHIGEKRKRCGCCSIQ